MSGMPKWKIERKKGLLGDGNTCEGVDAKIAKYPHHRWVKDMLLLNLQFRMVGTKTVFFQSQLQVARAIITDYSWSKLETGIKLMNKLPKREEGSLEGTSWRG